MSIQNETATLAYTIREAIRAQLLDMYTAMPARVEKYTPATQKADVQILLRKRYQNSEPNEYPVIPSVPVQWPSAGGGNAYVHLPLKAGDLGVIIVCSRSIDNWLSGDGQISSPDNPRHHDLSDSIFIPGVRPFKAVLANVSADNLVIQNNTLRIELDPSGKISIEGASEELLTVILGVIDHLIGAKVLTAMGPAPFLATTIADFQQDKSKLETLMP
ncbi:MAG: Gp138 family membrane-puncturing spike protein [bacterium]